MKHLVRFLSNFLILIVSANYQYDTIIIGGGIAGFVDAVILSNDGKSILLITDERPGGIFRGSGDATFNALLYFGNLYQELKKEEGYVERDTIFSLELLWKKISNIKQGMYSHITYFYAKDSGMEIVRAKGELLDEHTVRYDNTVVTAKNIIIATGAVPFISPIDGLDSINYYTYKTIQNMEKFPNELVVYGGGPQAITIARILSLFDVKITVIYRSKELLKEFDKDVVDLLQKLMEEKGVTFLPETEITKVQNKGATILITMSNVHHEIEKMETQGLYIATGTLPCIEGLHLDDLGIQYSRNGISINERFQTTRPSIYAIGDVTQYKHQSRYVTDASKGLASCLGAKGIQSYENVLKWPVARVLQLYPTIVAVGMTEQEAKIKYNNNYYVYKTYYKDNLKALLEQKTVGFVKFICSFDNQLVGVQMIGEQAEYLLYKLPLNIFLNDFDKRFDATMVTSYSYLELITTINRLTVKNEQSKNFFSKWVNWVKAFFMRRNENNY